MEKEVDFGVAMKPKTKKNVIDRMVLQNAYDLVPIKHKIMLYSKEIDKMVEEAQVHKVSDEQSLTKAVEMGTKAKGLWKQIKGVEKEHTDEPNQFVKGIRTFAKMFLERLENIERVSKKKVTDYQYHLSIQRSVEERKAREEAEKLEAELKKKAKKEGVEAPKVAEIVMPPPPKVTRTETGSSHQRMHWTFEVFDLKKLVEAIVKGEVDIKMIKADEKNLQQAVAMGLREIPGVKIFEKASTVFRT